MSHPGSCLPGSIFGVDTDDIFAYTTPRMVKIKDRSLGIINYCLMVVLFIYICIFTVWYQGKHFKEDDPDGVYRIQWQEPTKGCNPYNIDCEANYGDPAKLSYCSEAGGRHPCSFYDARELPITLSQGVLIPTYVQTFKQIRAPGCVEGASHCPRKWVYVDAQGTQQTGTGEAKPVSSHFVTDAGKFTMLIDHSFRAKSGKEVCTDLEGKPLRNCNDYNMQGRYRTCDVAGDCTTANIACKHDGCDKMGHDTEGNALSSLFARRVNHAKLRMQSTLQTDVVYEEELMANESRGALAPFAIEDGDIFSLERLYDMAGRSLEDNIEGASRRERGYVLVMDITYENKMNWRLFETDPPWYTVKVSTRRATDFKHSFVKHEDDNSRTLVRAYGTYVIIKQNGRVASFQAAGILAVIGASAGLIMASAKITDFLMQQGWLFKHADEFQKAKFLETKDFHDDDDANEEMPPNNEEMPVK